MIIIEIMFGIETLHLLLSLSLPFPYILSVCLNSRLCNKIAADKFCNALPTTKLAASRDLGELYVCADC